MAQRQQPGLRQRQNLLQGIESDPRHHLAGPFVPSDVPTPPFTPPPHNSGSNYNLSKHFSGGIPPARGFREDLLHFRWVRVPSSSIKAIIVPIVLWANWELFTPGPTNPFSCFMFLSHPVTDALSSKPLYRKGYLDLVFLFYYVVVFSFIRQMLTIHVFQRFAKWWGIRSSGKVERFGEQGYALVYFGTMGAWGTMIMKDLPTWWYRTEYFWIDYPHWQMPAQLKRYYLMQSAYWLQQFFVLVLGLEKPRSDFLELCIHHFVTLWLIGWSYVINLTLIGNAVFVSMDIPDSFLALTKLLNYLDLSTRNVAFAIFIVCWSYFRHYLNIVMLKSVWYEFDLVPERSQVWKPSEGVWLTRWMKYEVFLPIALLQLVNLFWYFLIWRVLFRAIMSSSSVDDDRSDDEEDSKDD